MRATVQFNAPLLCALACALWLACVSGTVIAAAADRPTSNPLMRLDPADPELRPPLAADETRRLMQGPAPLREADSSGSVVAPEVERERLARLRQTLNPRPEPPATLRIKALEGAMDYDPEDQIIYMPGRTVVQYENYHVEADRLIFDVRLRELQAEGNVVLRVGTDELRAESLRYNLEAEEGVGFEVQGRHGPFYFRTGPPDAALQRGQGEGADDKDHTHRAPDIHRLSSEQAIFRDATITTCDFPVPHYAVRAEEAILFFNDRIFMRGAAIYVWGVPVFYLPFYTRSLVERIPWSIEFGFNSRSGPRVRVEYTYHYLVREPDLNDEDRLTIRSRSRTDVFLDHFGRLGTGGGVEHEYALEYGRHRGRFQLYGLTEGDREVVGPDADRDEVVNDPRRWRVLLRHRTQFTDELNAIIDVDEYSDPDVFYDILDLFADDFALRQRQPFRRGRAALTWTEEQFVARVMVDVRDRVGRDRLTNYEDPADDNRDFDINPSEPLEETDDLGLSSKRWGRVSQKAPRFDLATRWLPLGRSRVFYRQEWHAYNALDPGLNTVNTFDDAHVPGGEFYNALLHSWQLSERYNLLTRLGVGAGVAERLEEPEFDYEIDPRTGFGRIDNVFFVDEEGTFLVGTNERNYEQIKPEYVWGDAETRLNARFSDSLSGALLWRGRAITQDYIGDWYRSIGNTLVREDIYDYKLRENWVEGRLYYRLIRPRLNARTSLAQNLIPPRTLYSKEYISVWDSFIRWANQSDTIAVQSGLRFSSYQQYDPTNEDELEALTLSASPGIEYEPVHKRWRTRLRFIYNETLTGNAEETGDRRNTLFSDEDPEVDVEFTIGGQIGRKWRSEFSLLWDQEYQGVERGAFMIERDLHDAIVMLRILAQRDETDLEDRLDQRANRVDVRLGLRFKALAELRGSPLGGPGLDALGQFDYRILRSDAESGIVQ